MAATNFSMIERSESGRSADQTTLGMKDIPRRFDWSTLHHTDSISRNKGPDSLILQSNFEKITLFLLTLSAK
eukprot:CAMPEP_0169312104 /NCGR_PEP_ID=MMETSP1017-20121227/3850_1 /TAXON_ID=342587 /ORGANISM="Karlodinium micrum, Strain CCMP2283" /LENGTH=71 /DNA_ID=CAMNT_0009405841 /DNA_START=480 /DNA_END=695 /DNA_ORIENTATION=+